MNRFLILTLLLGLFVRLFLALIPGFKFDVDVWFSWAVRLNEVGIANFYSNDVWTGYTPGFLYILGILGFIKNLLQLDSTSFYFLLKLPSIFAEIALGYFVYKTIPRWRIIGLLLIIFNPAFIFNSAVFGQFDGLFSLTMVMSVYFLAKNKPVMSSILAGISLLLKPQAIFLAPVFIFFLVKNFSVKNILYLSTGLLTVLVGFLPFFINNPINGPAQLVQGLLDFYPYGSIFAYNFWGIFGFWIPDQNIWFGLNYQDWGYLIFAVYWLIIILFWKKKNIVDLATLANLSFFFLITRMHERYLYSGIVFLIISTLFIKSKIFAVFSIILSLIYFLNLYYVYIYYNLFYLKLPTSIYNQYLYDFAGNSQIISLIATLIFLIISYLKVNEKN